MIVRQLSIENFRGVRKATIAFSGHALLVGPNNVGKSTVLEALDLLLGPERVTRAGAVDEHDFYNGRYKDERGEPVVLRLEAVLTGLSDYARRAFRPHVEWWDREDSRLADSERPISGPRFEEALRVGLRATYDKDEDEFRVSSYFCHPPAAEDEDPPAFTRTDKRLCGFLYLRSLRTGSRALSLEKGTLLDIVLTLKEVQAAGMWENMLTQLRTVGAAMDSHTELRSVLDGIEERVRQFIPLVSHGKASGFHVTNLTREDLRRVVSLFLTCDPSTTAVPFHHAGSGTLNVLVLAMLTFIADLKQSFIFAMEEPEIAIPPYTQRRIVGMLRGKAQQCIVTSHSPYVGESFLPDELLVLRRGSDHELVSTPVSLGVEIKRKMFRREFRTRFAESILSRGVLVVEGVSEEQALPVASDLLAAADSSYMPLDVSGVTVIDAGGDGNLEALGAFFSRLGLRTYAFHDRQDDPARTAKIAAGFDRSIEHDKKGFERLLTDTAPLGVLHAFLLEAGTRSPLGSPAPRETDPEDSVRQYVYELLKTRKGDGYAAVLVGMCSAGDLPGQLVTLLRDISSDLRPADGAQ